MRNSKSTRDSGRSAEKKRREEKKKEEKKKKEKKRKDVALFDEKRADTKDEGKYKLVKSTEGTQGIRGNNAPLISRYLLLEISLNVNLTEKPPSIVYVPLLRTVRSMRSVFSFWFPFFRSIHGRRRNFAIACDWEFCPTGNHSCTMEQ